MVTKIARLIKPYSQTQRNNFIIDYNHKLGYTITEDKNGLIATYTRDKEQEDRANIARLHVTRLDFINILELLGINWANVKAFMTNYPEVEKELMMCSNVYRGNGLIDGMIPIINNAFGTSITPDMLDEAFVQKCGYTRLYNPEEDGEDSDIIVNPPISSGVVEDYVEPEPPEEEEEEEVNSNDN